ncbi:MAG: quinolinate synthase NadA [Planctomycetia bacterium]|nr:quinolinate synthase NadA [Planctomycetia bacterium]
MTLAYQDYETRSESELLATIESIRQQLGTKLSILAHYYAPDEVVALADHVGDSLALAKIASQSSAEAVLFCGVRFMLETADILMNTPEKLAQRGGKRAVVMAADATAGCPMADMITSDQAYAWRAEIESVTSFADFTPITYVNSSAETKAFCGRYGGAVCTSANAERVVRDALAQRPKLLFMPDSRLGRTTALTLGVSAQDIATWRPGEPLGGLSVDEIRNARVILWDGYCPIHQKFSTVRIGEIKREYPQAQVWVHPESPREIVEISDGYGSTTKLLDVVMNAPEGATLAIGTEWKLVDRMARENPGKRILFPGVEPSICQDMSKSTLQKVAWALDAWRLGEPVNVVTAPENARADAYKALEALL